jgi:hypothetical protein
MLHYAFSKPCLPTGAIEGLTGSPLRKRRNYRPRLETGRGWKTEIELGITRAIGNSGFCLRIHRREKRKVKKIWGYYASTSGFLRMPISMLKI